MEVRDHRARRDPLARGRDDAGGAAILDQDLADRGGGADFDPASGAGARHRLGDRAHAADRMTPRAPPAVHLAPAMMHEHVAGSRRIGAGIGSDDPVEAEDRLDRIALEPLVEDIAGRTGEELDKIALPFEPERTQAVCDFGCVQEAREAGGEALSGREIGGRLERERAQDVGQALEPRLIRREPFGVAGGEFRHLRPGAPRPGLEVAPVGQGEEIRQRALDQLEAVAMEVEIADDCRAQKRDRIGGDGIAEAGMEFLRRRGAADLSAPLEHRDFEAGGGEIGGGDQSVMAAADDDHVRHHIRENRARRPSPQPSPA